MQKVGLRFAGVALPHGAVIRSAYVQFGTDEAQIAPAILDIAGHAADDAPGFTTASKDVSGRARTAAVVTWNPGGWPTVGARGVDQRTPDLSAVVQEIVDRPGWTEGNALSLVVTGSGTRNASAFERGAGRAPVLHVEYGPAAGAEPVNAAPVVDAGPDVALVLPAGATLTGSLGDDELPAGAPVTAAWTTVSGPGAVTFATPTAASTGVTFGAAGTYVLRLTGSGGQLTSSDDVTVTVSPAPVPSGVVDVRVQAGADDEEERSDGKVTTNARELTLGRDGTKAQTVGLRFAGVAVPAGARITKAYVQFQADGTNAQSARLTVVGQAADDAAAFSPAKRDVSARPTTSARVGWLPAGWSAGLRSTAQRTPDLTSVVQEVVSRPGSATGNALVLVVAGDGTRVAEAVEGGAAKAPVLHIEYGPAPVGG